jgi:ribosome biogenesis GTPase A
MIAEQQADGTPIAVVALDLSEKETTGKQVKQLTKLIMGATEEARDRQVLVCGIPNSGKSSLILPLTRARTLLHKKKQHYHLPKVSAAAGRTLGLKKHHLELPWKQLIALIDSPGLRPRLEDFKRYPETLAMLLAVRAIEPYRGYRDDVGDRILVKMLGALNRHALISETTPDYVEKFKLPGPIHDAQSFLYAARRSFNRATLTDSELILMCQKGELGGILFGDGPILTDIPPLNYKRQLNSAIVYMNEEALRLYKIGAALTPTSRG